MKNQAVSYIINVVIKPFKKIIMERKGMNKGPKLQSQERVVLSRATR